MLQRPEVIFDLGDGACPDNDRRDTFVAQQPCQSHLGKGLAALPGDLTVFIVSQRAASLQHADQIIVLDDGRMVVLGRHAELLESCPVYKEIYESQFKKGDAQK